MTPRAIVLGSGTVVAKLKDVMPEGKEGGKTVP
jgi:hypothetical protein